MPKKIPLVGLRFGSLVVRAETRVRGRLHWLCRCDCATEYVASTAALRNGQTRQCLQCSYRGRFADRPGRIPAQYREHAKVLGDRYRGMIERCYSPTAAKYKYYGERGIVVCDEWRSSINAFRGWALDNGFSPQRTLDRINTDGPYAPENCRWATPEEQNRNRRPFFTLHGVEDGARRSELVAAANDLLIAAGLRHGSISILKDAA